jgi:hypothetical protein
VLPEHEKEHGDDMGWADGTGEPSHCLYARANFTASSKEANCNRATSVHRGGPKPATKSCTYKGSVSVSSRHSSAMKRLQKSSTEPTHRRCASSPIGLSINGGPKREWMCWTKRCQLGWPPLSSNLWNQS